MTDDDVTLPNEASVTTESATPRHESPEQAKERERVEKVLAKAKLQFRTAINAMEHYRKNARLDTMFRAGTWGEKSYQWPDGIKEERDADGRASLTINRVPGFIRLVTNQQRQANLRIRVKPVDDYGDVDVAEAFQGIIRNIETTSFADRAYAKAGDKQAETGLGFITLDTEWAEPDNPTSFRQRIKIKQCKEPLGIVIDPSAQEPDWSDAGYAFEFTDIDADKWREISGLDDPPQATAFSGNDSDQITGDWFPNGKIRVAKYWHREPTGERVRVALLSDGRVLPHAEAQKEEVGGIKIINTRTVVKTKMMLRLIDATHILEESVWSGGAQPHIPVIGDELQVDGVRDFRGVPRDAKGSLMAYNVMVSGLVEQVGMGQKAPVVGYRGQFGAEGSPQRNAWMNAHKKPVAFLEVDPIEIDGKPAPFPQRNTFEPPLQGTILAVRQMDEDSKTTGGFRDASLAQKGPQESGVAIQERQAQDLLMNSHYLDNLRFALCAAGKQLIKLIRAVYDAPQVVRILGKDERPKKVMVFAGAQMDPRNPEYLKTHEGPDPLQMKDGTTVPPGQKIPFELPEGVTGIFNLATGEYDVEVSATPDPGSRRDQDLQMVGEVLKGMPPELATKFLDLYFMLLDSSIGQQMAERAKKMFPPPEEQQDGGGMPPEAQAAIGEMQQQMQMLMQELQAAQQELQSEHEKVAAQVQMNREKLASNEKIADADRQADAADTRVKLAHEEYLVNLESQMQTLQQAMVHMQGVVAKGLDNASQVDARAHASKEKAHDRVAALVKPVGSGKSTGAARG